MDIDIIMRHFPCYRQFANSPCFFQRIEDVVYGRLGNGREALFYSLMDLLCSRVRAVRFQEFEHRQALNRGDKPKLP